MTYRILVTSSRTWADIATVEDALADATALIDQPILIVTGACPCAHCHRFPCECGKPIGGDAIADAWARRYAALGIQPDPHPADWATWGRSAGYRRNAEMVEAGANQCLAFVNLCPNPACHRPKPHGSHGATHCANLAQGLGIPTTWWRPWDTPDQPDDAPDQPDLFTTTEEGTPE